ncbi:hypothetical protein A2U01_0061349, partial [Trifolium medium]|nr:hypothetical protein [Trifolium medium]
SEFEEGHGDPEARRNVNMLVEKLAEGLEEEESDAFQGKNVEENSDKPEDTQTAEGESEEEGVRSTDLFSLTYVHVESSTNMSMGPQGESEGWVLRTGDSSGLPVSQERRATPKPAAEESG